MKFTSLDLYPSAGQTMHLMQALALSFIFSDPLPLAPTTPF